MAAEELRELLSGDYSSRLNKIENEIEKTMPSYRAIFSSYTGHDKIHLNNVEHYVNCIIPDDIKLNLSEEEIFCLLCAIQLHDIGMIPIGDELAKFENKNKEERENFRNIIREKHHTRSKNYILNHKELFDFSDLEAEAIGKIAKGHRVVELEKYKNIHSEDNIRIRSLAAVLRLADECDITDSRESSLSQENVDNKTKKEHFNKHNLFKNVRFDSEHITLTCYIYEDENKKTISSNKDKIQKELTKIKPYLRELNIMLNDIKLDIHSHEKYRRNKVLLTIAEGKDISSLKSEWISSSDLEETRESLLADNTIEEINNENDTWSISEDITTFKKVFINFSNTYRNNFFFTKYSQIMVEKYFHHIENLFNIDYNLEHEKSERFRNERIKLLKMSPTAFYLLSTIETIVKDPDFNIRANQNGALMLDFILSFGLFNDMHNCLENIKFDEIINFFDKNFNKDDILLKINFYQKLK